MSKKDEKNDKKDEGIKLIIKNKKAYHDYEILERMECGIVLSGTEVKSLRDNNITWGQAYVRVEEGRLILIGVHIAEYAMGNVYNHRPEAVRTLLAHRREINKLRIRVEEKGLTLVPLAFYWKHGLCKVEIGVGRGKALHDKRESLRNRDMQRQMDRDARIR